MKVSEEQLIASICRESYSSFVQEFWHTVVSDSLIWNWHMQTMCDEIQAVMERVFRGLPKKHDLVTNVCPGSSKSTVASVMLLPWCWTRMAHLKMIGASYAYPLALDLSRKSRDVVKSELYQACFPEIRIRDDQDTKGNYVNTQGGMRFACGSLGTVQGMHGHAIVIDDPLNPNQAVSEVELYSINNWIKETLSGRKVDRRIAPTILVMQRLHQDDPTAQFLQRERVRHVCIPARLRDNVSPPELRQKYVEGLMDPVRLPKDVLDETEHDIGVFAMAGQYDQSPVPASGGMFDVSKLTIVQSAPPMRLMSRVVRYWDKAGTAGKVKRGRGAFTVGAKLGVDEHNRVFIMDIERVRMGSFDREMLIKQVANGDGRQVHIWTEQEPGSGGKESAETTIRGLLGYVIRADRPSGDKEMRADPLSVQVNGGNVYVVEGDWNEDFIEEMRFFPFSTYKDQVDACAGGFNRIWRSRRRVGGIQSRDKRKRSADVVPGMNRYIGG